LRLCHAAAGQQRRDRRREHSAIHARSYVTCSACHGYIPPDLR
jgi:ribosomal protein L32